MYTCIQGSECKKVSWLGWLGISGPHALVLGLPPLFPDGVQFRHLLPLTFVGGCMYVILIPFPRCWVDVLYVILMLLGLFVSLFIFLFLVFSVSLCVDIKSVSEIREFNCRESDLKASLNWIEVNWIERTGAESNARVSVSVRESLTARRT